jgi:hypothetical protein
MILEDVISQLHELPEATFICARRPWNYASDVVLIPFPDDLRIPDVVKAEGYEYFLEVSTAKEILEGFIERKPTLRQTTDFVVHYAEYDAFPQWAEQI